MTSAILYRYKKMLRDGFYDVVPQWMRSMFWAEPNASLLAFGAKKPTRKMKVLPTSALRQTGHAPRRKIVVDAILPHDVLLERTINIPPSPPSSHHAMAELDLLRRTPFTAQEVNWVIQDDLSSRSTQLNQWIAKRADINSFRTALSTHGYTVRKFLVSTPAGPLVLVDLTATVSPRGGLWRKLNGCLCAGIIALLGAIWLQPVWIARAEVTQNTVIVDRLRARAVALRTEIETLNKIDTARTDFVNTVMRRPRVVDAIRQLTVVLPDSVWATDLLVADQQLTLSGETSQSAANLVLELTQSNLPYVPALAGPVSRTNEGKERFSIIFTAKRDVR